MAKAGEIIEVDDLTKPIEIRHTKTLHEKLVEVFKEVEYVGKHGENTFQKYKYVKAADVAKAVRMKLFERGVLILPNETECRIEHFPSEGKVSTEVCLTVEYTFTDGKETIVKTAYGMARSNDDKAIWKAKTGATKYLLRQFGLIPDEKDDPEHEDAPTAHEHESNYLEEDHTIPDKKGAMLEEACLKNGHSQMAQAQFLGKLGYPNWYQVKNKDLNAAWQWASSPSSVPQELAPALEQSLDMAKAPNPAVEAIRRLSENKCGVCGSKLSPSKQAGGPPYCVPCWKKKKGL